MDCCPCSETAEQRYARWDREASEAKAAALASPDTWIPQGGVEDAGDIGGDIQAGTAHSRRFIRWIPSIGMWAVLNNSYYVAQGVEPDSDGQETTWVESQSETIICRDPSDPGGTEEWSDYEYSGRRASSIRGELDAYAREQAEASSAEDFSDPPRNVLAIFAS